MNTYRTKYKVLERTRKSIKKHYKTTNSIEGLYRHLNNLIEINKQAFFRLEKN